MRKFFYLIILMLGFSLVFCQAKPCCKNKTGSEKVSCKTNQANININDDSIISISEDKLVEKISSQNNSNISTEQQTTCNGCNKKSQWWKFWKKQDSCSKTKIISDDTL
jgi:hypothetical protein